MLAGEYRKLESLHPPKLYIKLITHVICAAGHTAPPAATPPARALASSEPDPLVTSAAEAADSAGGGPVRAMPAAATGANPHAADDVESRTLRWLTLWLIALANRNAPLRADARLTLRTQRLGPWHGGWLRGSLQLGAGAGFVLAAAITHWIAIYVYVLH